MLAVSVYAAWLVAGLIGMAATRGAETQVALRLRENAPLGARASPTTAA